MHGQLKMVVLYTAQIDSTQYDFLDIPFRVFYKSFKKTKWWVNKFYRNFFLGTR